jgi:hypothetical protein
LRVGHWKMSFKMLKSAGVATSNDDILGDLRGRRCLRILFWCIIRLDVKMTFQTEIYQKSSIDQWQIKLVALVCILDKLCNVHRESQQFFLPITVISRHYVYWHFYVSLTHSINLLLKFSLLCSKLFGFRVLNRYVYWHFYVSLTHSINLLLKFSLLCSKLFGFRVLNRLASRWVKLCLWIHSIIWIVRSEAMVKDKGAWLGEYITCRIFKHLQYTIYCAHR